MNKDLIFATHMAHAVMIEGETFMPTKYMVAEQNILDLLIQRSSEMSEEVYLTYYSSGGVHRSYTYNDFRKQVFQTANLLKSKGLIEESRVAILGYNHPDVVVFYFAAWCAGMTVVPLNASESKERLQFILENSETAFLFYLNDYQLLAESLKTEALEILSEEDFHKEKETFPDSLALGGVVDTRKKGMSNFDENATFADLETEAMIVYTSGTTGNPKGVVLTQYNLLVDANAIARHHGLVKGDAMMCVLPIHHVNGTVVTLVTPMIYGGRVVLNQKFSTEHFFERLANEKVQIVSVVPTLLQFLHAADINLTKYDLSGFRHFICGAGPLTVELVAKFEKHYGFKVIHGYGLSETTCYSCFLPTELEKTDHDRWLKDFGFPSIGVPLPINEMAILNERGEKVREGWRGEIVIRGHNVMKGYFKNPDANIKAFEKGWFHSGDEGFFKVAENGQKYFFITGRLKELIIRGGVNLSPFEIDEVLNGIDGVRAAIAVGFENDWYGEEVGAYVSLKSGVVKSKEEIISECAKRLPFQKCPKVIVFGDEIPVTSTGKYQRGKVKHLFAEWKSVQFKG
ncbi:MAG: class I adenylate-forming enzyme family protein [Chloroherpetonaceae bacterium]|nr:class I adenylate-forming enzyme family protein [Chloroherpetonaceae bacterium]